MWKIHTVFLASCIIVGVCEANCGSSRLRCASRAYCQSFSDICDSQYNSCLDNGYVCRYPRNRYGYRTLNAGRDETLLNLGLRYDNYAFKCLKPGFIYTGTVPYCKDINECEESSPCDQICTNLDGSYKCSCHSGYTLSEDQKRCNDIDECEGSKGSCSDICMNTQGSFHCLCQTGYKVQNIFNCTDINECEESSPCDHICTNLDGSYKCSCHSGYTLSEDQKRCNDIDECSNSTLNTCEQICLNSQGSYSCSCHSGYQFAENNSTCNDIDECVQIPRVCSQTCKNHVGNYSCECVSGYISTNEQAPSCEVEKGNSKIVYLTENNDIFVKVMISESKYYLTRRPKTVIKTILFNPLTDEILVLETYPTGGKLLSIPLSNETPPTVLLSLTGNPEDMALDYVNRKVYITDSQQSSVIVYNMFLTNEKTLLKIVTDFPSSIVIDAQNRYFYYANLGEQYKGIYKSRMDGKDCEPFITSEISRPTDLFLDETTSVLYWIDSSLSLIEMASLDGKTRRVLLSATKNHLFKEPLSIYVFEDLIFWTQANSSVVYSANKRNYNASNMVQIESSFILKVIVGSSYAVNYTSVNNSCDGNECDQMCLLGPNNISSCACFEGFKMDVNSTICTGSAPRNDNGTVLEKVGNLEAEEKIDYESLKQTAEVNLLRTLVEKTEDLVEQYEKITLKEDSQ